MPDRRSDTGATSWASPWLLVPGLLALGAGVRALRFAAPFHWPFQWDETQLGTAALQVLDGGLPANAGPEYFGATPAYVLAVWFAVAGASTRALDVFAYGMALLVLWLGWLLLRRFLDRPAALFGLAILAAPPLYLSQWTFTAAPNQPALLILGHLCLLATHTVFVRSPGRRRALLALGLFGGLGWWTSPLIVVYLAPFGLLALRTGLVLRASMWLFVVGFVVGGLPQLLYELSYFPSARFALHEAGGVSVLSFGVRVTTVAGTFIPTLLGFDARSGQPWLAAFLGVSLPLWGIALARAAVRDRGELAWALGLKGQLDRGHVILWIVAATNLLLVLVTQRAIDAYYLLSIYAVLPCWMGEALDWLRRRRGPLLAGVALAALLLLQGWPNWRDSFAAPDKRRWQPLLARYEPLFRWFGDRGIDREPGQPAQPAGAAVDGDRGTRWVSRAPGHPAQDITLDLGRARDLRGVEVRPGIPGRELRLWGSEDGVAWTPLEPLTWAGSLYWTGSELLRNGGAKWAAVFPRTRLRYLRLSPAGPLRDPWAIAEIECLE